MARRKKNDNSAGAAIIYFGFIILLILVSIAPIFILLYGLFYIFKFYFKYQTLNKDYSDFWLNDKEKAQYRSSFDEWLEYDNEINDLEWQAEENNVSVNANGKYSRKSKIGKKVQDRLDDILPIWESARDTKEYLETLPYSRWQDFHLNAAKGLAGVLAAVIWAFVFEYFCTSYKIEAAQLFKDYSNFLFYEAGNVTFGLSGLAAIIGFFVIRWILGFAVNGMYSPEPPLVDPVNVDEY